MAGIDARRQAVVDRLLADPPAAHVIPNAAGELLGVWSTEDSCYQLIASVVRPGDRTLETGCGLSTALFAALGARHTCVTPAPEEAERLRAYLGDRGLESEHLVFCIESSHTALPRLAPSGSLDVVFIDGDHGFPLPVVDWFYAGGRLRSAGTLVVDDIQVAAVAVLIDALEADEGWTPLERTEKWAAYTRVSEGPLHGGAWNSPPAYSRYPSRSSRRPGPLSRLLARL